MHIKDTLAYACVYVYVCILVYKCLYKNFKCVNILYELVHFMYVFEPVQCVDLNMNTLKVLFSAFLCSIHIYVQTGT